MEGGWGRGRDGAVGGPGTLGMGQNDNFVHMLPFHVKIKKSLSHNEYTLKIGF